jgi:hypothetical protein
MRMREYRDFRLDMSRVDEQRFLVNATCSVGETRGAIEVTYDRELIRRITPVLEAPTINPRELLEMATVLGDLLLPGEALDLFLAAFPEHPEYEGIRLRLVIRDSDLAAIPWEYAYVPLGEDSPLSPYLALHPAVSVIRHEAQPSPQPSLAAGTDGAFRILIASGLSLPDLPPLSIGIEGTVIGQALQETHDSSSESIRFDLTLLPDPATTRSLEQALQDPFDLFQFSGHSISRELFDRTSVAGLAVAGPGGSAQLMGPDRLAAMLVGASVRVAFLNVCSPPGATGADRLALAAELVGAGIPAVISMQFPVEDSHAIAFSKGLYSALAAGLSLDEAVSLGRRRMHELGILTNWGAPVTFSRSADGRLFTPATAGMTNGPARIAAYQAGRGVPPAGPVEPGMRIAIAGFCERWHPPEIRDERAEINAVSIAATDANELDGRVTDLLRVLGTSYPEPLSSEELCRQLLIKPEAIPSLLHQTNQQVEVRQRRSLSRFSVEADQHGYRLRRLPVAHLLDRSPDAHAGLDYQLRLALSLYDAGRYGEAVAQMVTMFDSMSTRPGTLTVPEHALFFYYLSKALLKLNWYDELQDVLEGPYCELSQSLLKDLEVERLHVSGIRFRQLGDLTAAQACFDGAVNILLEMLGSSGEPVLLRGLGDSYVLQAQCRLDHVVQDSLPTLVREAGLRTATEALEQATSCFARNRQTTGAGIHYEGRLYGARAFLGVATSLIQPTAITRERWRELEALARGGFEPERERKPFGIVAGKYALAVVLLAKARWHMIRIDDTAGVVRAALDQANMLLRSVFEDYLEPGYVQLGPVFEMPKIELAARTVEELRAASHPDMSTWHEISSRRTIWSPVA